MFTHQPVTEHITRIVTPCGVCMYLVEGTDRAALLDTGFGFGDLRGFVASLTGRPLEVLLSHGHMDHAGGASQFDSVHLNEIDWELERWHNTRARRIWDVRHGPGGMPEGVTDDDFLPDRTRPYLPLGEGDVFALGGVTVEPIAVPGHTTGSLVFLIPEDRVCVFGDACGENTLLLFQESTPIPAYRAGLLHLKEFEDRFDLVLRNHGSFTSPKEILRDTIELCEDIMAGRDAAIPSDFMGQPGMLGRPKDHPGKAGNILYDPARRN